MTIDNSKHATQIHPEPKLVAWTCQSDPTCRASGRETTSTAAWKAAEEHIMTMHAGTGAAHVHTATIARSPAPDQSWLARFATDYNRQHQREALRNTGGE